MDMNRFHDNFMLTNGLPVGTATGIGMNERTTSRYNEFTEYEKEKLLAEGKNRKNNKNLNQSKQNIKDQFF